MAPQCDICFAPFDLNHHRPRSLPCGHTICKECVQNPALGRKCPTCRKGLTVHPDDLPDNIFVIQMIEDTGEPPRKMPRREDARVQQLQRALDAARKVVTVLQQVVPAAVEALQRHLDSSAAELRQMEETLEKLQRGEATGEAVEDADTMPNLAATQLQLEESLRLLSTNKISVAAEDGETTWTTSMQLGRFDDILRLLLLQLRAGNQLRKVDVADPSLSAPYVGPPGPSILSINTKADIHGDHLKVNEILRNGQRWKNVRTVKNLKGLDSEKLLRVLAPQLEELEIAGRSGRNVLEEVQKMKSLRRVVIKCEEANGDYPDLPLQLEELAITWPSESQLRCVQRMPQLRSLLIDEYFGPDVAFPPAQVGGLLWMGLCFNVNHKDTMLSLIRAHAASLQELHVFCSLSPDDMDSFFFPDLGRELAASGLRALRRVVMERLTNSDPCEEVEACLMQLRTIRDFLHHSVDVICDACHKNML